MPLPASIRPSADHRSRPPWSRSSSSNSLPTTGGTRAPADDAAVIAYLDAQVADAGYPGASIAIVRAGHVAELHAIGAADRTGRPVTTDTPFVIGSVSKSLTALAILRLVDAGAVDLDAPITRYVPGFRTAAADAAPITIRAGADAHQRIARVRHRPVEPGLDDRRPGRVARRGAAGRRARGAGTPTPTPTTWSSGR